MNRLLLSIVWMFLTLISLPSALAQESGWPRTLPLEQGMVTIYSLQVDEMSDDVIHFRAALAYRATPDSEPVFGAGWFESRVRIDASNRIVHPMDLKVTETRFPAGTDDVQSELSLVLAQRSPVWNLDFSLDELEAALQTAETESQAVNTAPPQIVYRDHPALLISMDGEPVLREIKNSPFEAVINTPYPLIFDGKHYYLNAAKDVWYRASKATGPYQFETNPPADIAAMVNASDSVAANKQPVESITAANTPEILVSTEPTELIVTEGPAAFVPLVDDLLVLQNSDDDVFMHISSQKFYIVLAGRWYRANSLNGPWAYQSADKLPIAFANIPQDSNQADSRVYVAGTDEARDAVMDAQIPQTAKVARGEVDIEVKYDGEPIYEPVDGTDLVYIQNTGSTVIQSGSLYYLVEDGVWYVSSSPNGAWQVSDHRPAQVDTILPTSPVYNAKYVHVYESTPSVVYVGYTPGYTGSYIYHNTIVYGSGWNYSPWVSPYYYYPRHSTWGFNVSYNSWGGWNYGLSWGWGLFGMSYYSGGYWHQNQYWHHRHYGRWGPGGYRSRPVHYGNRYDRYGHNNYGYNRRGHNDNGRDRNGNHRSNTVARNDNLYRDRSQRARIADTRDRQPATPVRRRDATRQANYLAASGSRQRNDAGPNKGRRDRTDPVSPSDIRVKANLRDVNLEAARSRLLTDNSGNVYRGTDRGARPVNTSNRRSPSAKSTKSQTMPLPPTRQQTNLRASRRDNGKIDTVNVSRSRVIAASRAAQNQVANNRSTQRSSQAVNAPVRQSQGGQRNNKTRQRLTPVSNGPVRQSQGEQRNNKNRQRLTKVSNGPVRQSQPRPGSKSARQQPVRMVATAPQKQTSSLASTQPKRSRNNGHKNSAPAQSAPQKSTQRANSKQNTLNNGGHNRTGGNRSRR